MRPPRHLRPLLLALCAAVAGATGVAGALAAPEVPPSVPPPAPAGAQAVAPALALTPRQVAQSRLHYMQHCMGCHLADGSGAPDKGIPSMQGALGRFLAVPGGREFIVQVPGVMNAALTDAEVAQLMNWLLPQVSVSTLPPDTAAYTAAEISRLRQTRPLDVPAARAALVAQWAVEVAR
ncbi:c-type cytochrome [Ideonella livida]|uniref:Cytochrome c n=1 Tax=Ideonella livida TaxID=2707176 RepID=A0A7C9TKD8_9BURK|nr:cytochrome c [Ideonella livida]NDY91245.1 cytochrome c [Ideonella livida]